MLFTIFLLSVASFVAAENACPPYDALYPCFCEEEEPLPEVSCSSIRDLDKLRGVFRDLAGYNITFGFWSSKLGDIPSDLFANISIESLHFEECKVSSFGARPFSGLEDSLKKLYIYSSIDAGKKKEFGGVRLGHLGNLEDVLFADNFIGRLGNDWFEGGPESLLELNLNKNRIDELGDTAFAPLKNLEQIWIAENRISKLSRSMFPRPAEKLYFIEMSYNQLADLPVDFFDAMPALRRVSVASNRLQTISEDVWGKIWPQLRDVYFEKNNALKCDKKLKWIYQQKLPGHFNGYCGASSGLLTHKKLNEVTLEELE